MAPVQLAAPLATTLKDHQSPNLKTALRLLEASYFILCGTDNFTWTPLPDESLSALGWSQCNKSKFIDTFQNVIWKWTKNAEYIITEVVENESDVILYVNLGHQSVSLAGKSLASSHVFRLRFDADGKIVEEKDFLDSNYVHEFWLSGPGAKSAGPAEGNPRSKLEDASLRAMDCNDSGLSIFRDVQSRDMGRRGKNTSTWDGAELSQVETWGVLRPALGHPQSQIESIKALMNCSGVKLTTGLCRGPMQIHADKVVCIYQTWLGRRPEMRWPLYGQTQQA
ncbi:uncharacterized protein EI90DRAFT_3014369 [Cantharellus anzutake]|uniref:uncharacterized protein n=1 Tax=Cantharellus anzutake TaxID=1750568 RepID=UPI001907C87F|nr:uncharacterized protein EI90DRAFT_3014369 [Cantharellus anzutake]KAF8335727.1 hypothetical protein EI90DRAFT_3014369 [Cantharellus anzutake]